MAYSITPAEFSEQVNNENFDYAFNSNLVNEAGDVLCKGMALYNFICEDGHIKLTEQIVVENIERLRFFE